MIHPAELQFSLERRQGAERADFVALLRSNCPELLRSALPQGSVETAPPLTHGTTILAAKYDEGVLIAGDRQATAGYEIAEREIEKVMEMDHLSAVAIAGVAGPAAQMAKLLQTQIEFYEKVEGIPLSLEGKANYLTHLVTQNLPAAMQGFVVAPLFAGYDQKRRTGRIFKYDPAGGQYEERAYCATGSGGKEAYIVLKKRCKANMTREEAVHAAVEALLDASDEDIATGGFDFVRGVYPTVKTVSAEGVQDAPTEEIRSAAEALLEQWRADYAARRQP